MKKKIKHLLFLIVLIGIDQIAKYFARAKFADGDSFSIIPKVLKLVYHENTGAVWGIMSDQTILLAIITFIALVAMLWIYFRIPDTKRYIPMQIILLFVGAGAIGNLIDRVLFGFVTDFIYFELIDFPVFNIADSYITVSVVLLAILGIFYYKEEDFEYFSFKKKHQEEN